MGKVEPLDFAGSIDVDPWRSDAPTYAFRIHHSRDIRDQRAQPGQGVCPEAVGDLLGYILADAQCNARWCDRIYEHAGHLVDPLLTACGPGRAPELWRYPSAKCPARLVKGDEAVPVHPRPHHEVAEVGERELASDLFVVP